jgi:hypothetical protein
MMSRHGDWFFGSAFFFQSTNAAQQVPQNVDQHAQELRTCAGVRALVEVRRTHGSSRVSVSPKRTMVMGQGMEMHRISVPVQHPGGHGGGSVWKDLSSVTTVVDIEKPPPVF